MNRVYDIMGQLPPNAKLYIKTLKKHFGDFGDHEPYYSLYAIEENMVEKLGVHEYKQIYYIIAASWSTKKHL